MPRPADEAEPGAFSPGRWGWGVAWAAGLLFAFAPSLKIGIEHLTSQPWTRATLVFPLLALLAARREARPGNSRVGGWLVALGIGIQLMAIGGGIERAGRLGFVLAAIGLSRAVGWCSWRVAFLLAFLLPLPQALVDLGSPWLEGGFASAGAAMARGLGFDVRTAPDLLVSGASTLRLSDHDGGLALLFLLTGLAWFIELCAPSPDGRAGLRRGIGCVVLAAGLQLAMTTASALVLGSGGPEAPATGRALLDHLPWLLTWAFGIGLAWKYLPADDSKSPGAIGEEVRT